MLFDVTRRQFKSISNYDIIESDKTETAVDNAFQKVIFSSKASKTKAKSLLLLVVEFMVKAKS